MKVFVVDKIISYTIVDGNSRLNIMHVRTMEKLGVIITSTFPHVIKMTNQSQNTSLGQINGYRMITSSNEYFFTFHVIHMHLSKNSYLLLLGRS